jgi:hypothetical protein
MRPRRRAKTSPFPELYEPTSSKLKGAVLWRLSAGMTRMGHSVGGLKCVTLTDGI